MKHGGSALYGIGIFGALFYYWTHATTFWAAVVGTIKGVFWPAVIVYKVFEMLQL